MTIEELKDWMDERFQRNEMDHIELKANTEAMNKKLTSHDRWLWLIRGIGVAGITVLGVLGWKIE